MIDRIASDLGIYQYAGEPLQQYKCRAIYSAMSCWIKTIALDRPVGYQEKGLSGVSRRHIYEKSHTILRMMITMFPELREWFDLSTDNDDPVNIIRTRLLNHGDLLNAGFDTHLALSSVHSNQITSTIETVYGKTIEKGLQYSGIATIRSKEASCFNVETENVKKWMQTYFNDVSWSHEMPESTGIQYFNPRSIARNNYAAWQESAENLTDKVILIKTAVNKRSYSYYLLKPKERLTHRIDPFLKEQGFHIRVMYALRSQSNNRIIAKVTKYRDCIKIKLNALLPLVEKTMVESYAWPVRCISDNLEWVMGYAVWEYIRTYIEALDILIQEE